MAMKAWPFVLADFVYHADVGVIQTRGGAGFALETGQCLRVFRHVIGQKFEGDETAEFQILGLIDNAHPAPAELFDNPIVRDGLTDHGLVQC